MAANKAPVVTMLLMSGVDIVPSDAGEEEEPERSPANAESSHRQAQKQNNPMTIVYGGRVAVYNGISVDQGVATAVHGEEAGQARCTGAVPHFLPERGRPPRSGEGRGSWCSVTPSFMFKIEYIFLYVSGCLSL
jgi:hypothetical protein